MDSYQFFLSWLPLLCFLLSSLIAHVGVGVWVHVYVHAEERVLEMSSSGSQKYMTGCLFQTHTHKHQVKYIKKIISCLSEVELRQVYWICWNNFICLCVSVCLHVYFHIFMHEKVYQPFSGPSMPYEDQNLISRVIGSFLYYKEGSHWTWTLPFWLF